MAFYPRLPTDTVFSLQVIAESLGKDPDYLDHPECPYDTGLKDFFRRNTTSGASVDLFAEGEDYNLVLDKQVEKVINDLEAFSKTLGQADQSEKLAYFKTKTTLLEKLIGMRERVHNLKELNEFRGTIISFLDEACTPDQITTLMHRLDGVFGTTKNDL